MSSYVVLARKWRSAQFADIVGQTHIVRTLSNAVRSDRIHQAYLFTGSRGIGKTSIARIFAKVLRCENLIVTDTDVRSCDQCSSCKEITSGTSVDVIEIDGASNNGVDAVREIRENAKYLPATGKRKIYVIDEVHMLTTAAFNALLKTLEEPPAHVVFIFATTESHKIPATILSRCQRFDYRRPTLAQIHAHLTKISLAEKIDADPAALTLISRAAEGSMRDALSLLDQVIAFAGQKISPQNVRDSIGLIESQTLLGCLRGIFERKPLDALHEVEQAYQRGHDLRVLTRSLIEALHGTILMKVGAKPGSTLEFSEEETAELAAIAALRPLEEIELIFQVLHHGLDWIARSPQPKVVLDVLLVKCASAESLVAADAGGSTGSGSGSGSGPRKPAAVSVAPAAAMTQAPRPTPAPEPRRAEAVAVAAPVASNDTAIRYAPGSPPVAQTFAPTHMTSSAPIAQPTSPTAPAASVAPAGATAAYAPSGPRTWEGFINHVRRKKPLLASILENGNLLALPDADGDLLAVGFQPKDVYFREQLQSRAYTEPLLALVKEYFGPNTRISIDLKEGGESLAKRRERESAEKTTTAREAAKTHPIIVEARSLFGGDLGPIELIEQNPGEAGDA